MQQSYDQIHQFFIMSKKLLQWHCNFYYISVTYSNLLLSIYVKIIKTKYYFVIFTRLTVLDIYYNISRNIKHIKQNRKLKR